MARRKPLDLSSLKPSEMASGFDQQQLEDFLDAVDEMRASGSFEWADQTLKEIYDWCKQAGRYTGKQVVAVNNIRYARRWDELVGL